MKTESLTEAERPALGAESVASISGPPEGHDRGEAEIAAEHFFGHHPEAGAEDADQRRIDLADDLATERKLLVALELAHIEVGVVLEVGSGRRQKAGHRATCAEQIEAGTVFGRIRRQRRNNATQTGSDRRCGQQTLYNAHPVIPLNLSTKR
ncbi:hypothetical protein [Ensifer adhaerens]